MRSEGHRLQIWAITLTGIVIYILLGDIMYTGLLLIALVILFLIGESILNNKNKYSDFGTNYLEENQIGGRDISKEDSSDNTDNNIKNEKPKVPIPVAVKVVKESMTSSSGSDVKEEQKSGSKRFSKISFV